MTLFLALIAVFFVGLLIGRLSALGDRPCSACLMEERDGPERSV